MKINYKSGYFWGTIFAIIYLTANVIALPILQNEMDKKLATVDFSQFKMKSLNGEDVNLKDVANGKKVLLNFWSTWCGPCLSEFPVIQESYKKTKDEFVYVMVSDEKMETIKKFKAENNYTFIFMQVKPFMEYGILSRPTTFILDLNLNIAEKIIGSIPYENEDDFNSFLEGIKFNVD